jgi:hypothetical protein
VRIWGIEEESTHPPLIVVAAAVWTPVRWRESRQVAWVAHADETLRALFPNLPEVIKGPWGSLTRASVLGPDEASSAMLDALSGLSVIEGGKIDAQMELGSYTMSSESLVERVESGKLSLGDGLLLSGFTIGTQAANIEIELPASLFKEEKKSALAKIDKLIMALDQSLTQWVPGLQRLADPALLGLADVEQCLAKARHAELERSTPRPDRAARLGLGGRI